VNAPFGRGPDGKPLAPYGVKADGSPRLSAGGRPPGRKNAPRSGGTRKPADPPKRRTTPNAAPKSAPVDYTGAVTEVATTIGAVVAMGSPLDGAVILTCAEEIGSVTNELAQINDAVRKVCDRFLSIGPWGRVSALGLKIGAQLAENHGWLPLSITSKFGALPRDAFVQAFNSMTSDMEAAQARAGDAAGAQMGFGSTPAAPYPAENANGYPPFERRDHAGV
jgi:hypothetical protein